MCAQSIRCVLVLTGRSSEQGAFVTFFFVLFFVCVYIYDLTLFSSSSQSVLIAGVQHLSIVKN